MYFIFRARVHIVFLPKSNVIFHEIEYRLRKGYAISFVFILAIIILIQRKQKKEKKTSEKGRKNNCAEEQHKKERNK